MIRLKAPIIGKVQIMCKDLELEEFAKRQFYNYVLEDELNDYGLLNSYVEIVADIDFSEFGLNFSCGKRAKKFIYQGDEINYCQMTIKKLSNGKIKLVIDGKTETEKLEMMAREHDKYSYYHMKFYNKILFPIFMLYALKDGYFLMHGSLLDYNEKILMICGLDGVGKSSIGAELCKLGAKIIADNFVLFNGKQAVPLNLAIRLTPDQESNLKTLYRDEELKEVVAENKYDTAVIVDKIYLLGIADKLYMEKKEKINLVNLVLYVNNAPEIGRANSFIGPFLIKEKKEKMQEHSAIDVSLLEIPYGQIEMGVEMIKNDN